MTAPDRIALRWELGAAVTSGPLMDHPDYTQYVRADLAHPTPLAEALAVPEVIAGRSLSEWAEFARRDDCLDRMVPSDLRQLVAALRAIGEPSQPITQGGNDE